MCRIAHLLLRATAPPIAHAITQVTIPVPRYRDYHDPPLRPVDVPDRTPRPGRRPHAHPPPATRLQANARSSRTRVQSSTHKCPWPRLRLQPRSPMPGHRSGTLRIGGPLGTDHDALAATNFRHTGREGDSQTIAIGRGHLRSAASNARPPPSPARIPSI
jgi:hypothetical protein